MADDVLLQKVYNFICGSGGFVELSVLFKRPAPLGSRKSELDSRKWLKSRSEFIVVKDHNGEENGVRINLRKKICQQYVVKGSCRRRHDKCKHWHICKRFIEEDCDGAACGLSHDFRDQVNYRKVNELGLGKYSNGSLRKIISWSLPKICELYLRNECRSDQCPYLHVCAKEAQGFSCNCALSHSLTDCHNMNVLKEYDLVPPSQIVNVGFVRCSILVLAKQECLSSSEGSAAETQKPATSRFKNSTAANVFFERLCKEFSCSVSLANLLDQKVVLSNELEDFLPLIEVNKDKFLVTRNERGTIQDVTAFCPELRLCPDFVSSNECRKNPCPSFHLCRKFVTGSCNRGESCSRSHSFRNKRDTETLSKLNLDGLTDEQLRQLMLSSSPQVCVDYNKSTCTRGSFCPRVHICKRYVTNACRKTKSCCLVHKLTFDRLRELERYMFKDNSIDNVLTALLICEEHDNACDSSSVKRTGESHSVTSLPTKEDDFVEKWTMDIEQKRSSSFQTRNTQHQESRSPASSSCSSVTVREKCNPSKKTVFESICKEYDGTVPFSVISKRRDLFPGNSKDIANWFRERNDKFLLREDVGGNILEVTSFCLKSRLCFNYLSSQSCSRDDCQYFHVCREYIAGSCKFFTRCKWRHDFQFDEDRDFISKLELDGLTQEELRKVVRFSMPQVCLDYNSGGCNRDLCNQIHICKDFVRRKCSDFDDCDLQHESALLTPSATAIFEKYGLTGLDASTKSMLREVLVCPNFSTRPEESRDSVLSNQSNLDEMRRLQPDDDFIFPAQCGFSTISANADPVEYSLPLRDENYNGSQRTSSTGWTPCFPSEQQVFECLCTEYDCSASFPAIAKRKDLFPHGAESADAWFRRNKRSFLITDSDRGNGKISKVEAFSTKARLCLNYTNSGKCLCVESRYLHVCKGYITDTCTRGESCSLNHHFHNKKDKALLSKIKLDILTEQQLRKLVLLSTPQLCVEYNNGICRRGDSCQRIHMCCGYLRKSCSRKEGYCGLEHEEALNTNHTQTVLKRLQMSRNVSKHDILKMILDDKLSLEAKDKTNCHIHQDKPDEDICTAFLIGQCHKGLRCRYHHCCLPYHWQYKDPSSGQWKSFGVEDNVALEKFYCDVDVETRVNFKPAQVLDLTYLKSPIREHEITIDLDDQLMFVKLPSFRGTFVSQLRRLSTVAYNICPCAYMPTTWTWYWEESGNIWKTYDKDRWERDLQNLIENAFLDKLEQVKQGCGFKLKFSTPEHDYELFFGTSKIYQINMETGTKRAVKRRPSKFVSNEDVDDLMWMFGDSSVREQLSKTSARYKYMPSYWSGMSPNQQYSRVGLASSNVEFEAVEQLFRRTMNDYVVIVSIERVQNPFMLEKYCRKKENMIATGKRTHETINEKRLFHGTSPDAVEAICKQNFDWRLNGKNATVYGEGSYFAVNASYSHAFARRDSSSFQFMFLAKVLVGSYTTGHSSFRRPPPKNPSDPASDLYDSCVDKQANPTIFVVFDADQFYPEYIIQYSTLPQLQTAVASAYAPPQPRATPSSSLRPKQGTRSVSYASHQPTTAPSRPTPPSSQPFRGTPSYPSRPSNTVSASIPNGSGTRSSSPLTTTASAVPMRQSATHVAAATNPAVPVSRGGHYSTTSTINSPSSSSPLGTATTASSNAARNVNHTVASSSRGITPMRQGGSSSQNVVQASGSNSSPSTPLDSKDLVMTAPPNKKKDCLIM